MLNLALWRGAVDEDRKLEWETGTRDNLRSFPEDVRWEFGQGLYLAQQSVMARTASRMKGRLAGVVELASDDAGDTYRLYYTIKCPGYVHVLYCHKKSRSRGARSPSTKRT
jgi:phage-related protein